MLATVEASKTSTGESLTEVQGQTVHNTVLSMSASALPLAENTVLHPPDNGGGTVLPTAALGDTLPPWGKLLWEQGGRLTATDEETRKANRMWKNDSAVTDKPYYTVMQGPIFNENPSPMHLVHDFPGDIPSEARGVTFNMWFQPLMINQTDSFFFAYYGGRCNVSGCKKPFVVHDSHLKRGPGCAAGIATGGCCA